MSTMRRTLPLLTLAVLVVTAVLGCSGEAPAALGQPSTTVTTPWTTPPNTPTVAGPRYSAGQARTIATLGQRPADQMMMKPVEAGLGPVNVCPDESAFVGAANRSWVAASTTPSGEDDGIDLRQQVRQVGRTVNAVVVLDDSPSAATAMDSRLRRWSSCSVPGVKRDRITVSAPGAGAAVGCTRQTPVPTRPHGTRPSRPPA